jgi:hypothetical protein
LMNRSGFSLLREWPAPLTIVSFESLMLS